ncbi:MAG: NCS2 family permease [Acidobacteria bacterium]|nr:NCS2 family permease [Acidobacteriota bacterium]
MSGHAPVTRGDLDGFFGLMVDNLLQFLVILALCTGLAGMPADFVLGRIFPGAAFSLLAGNLYYAWLARSRAQATGRPHTALPFGINTVSLFAFVLFIIAPTYQELAARPEVGAERAATIAWQVGLVACLLSGLIEAAGALFAERVRRVTPRAALLSTLAGIALGFISMEFVLKTFDRPLVALAPLAIVLLTYLGRVTWPLGLPGGLIALLAGTGLAWGLAAAGVPGAPPLALTGLWEGAGLRLPRPAVSDLWSVLGSPFVWERMAIIVPMGLINVLGSLQNVESAEADGDAYPAGPALFVNGAATIVAAALGSCFPTTIYIGHPGWKRMGAGWAYSAWNGIFFAVIALTGLIGPIARIVPIEAAMAILVWIAVVITAQAFRATPAEHAPAVVIGMLPGIAAWGWFLIEMTFGAARARGWLPAAADLPAFVDGLAATTIPYVRGLLTLKAGFLFSATLLAAIAVELAERRFARAALWALVAATFAWTGLMHAYTLTPSAVREEIVPGQAWAVAVGYLLAAGAFLAAAALSRRRGTP